jgi:hypothetical protein
MSFLLWPVAGLGVFPRESKNPVRVAQPARQVATRLLVGTAGSTGRMAAAGAALTITCGVHSTPVLEYVPSSFAAMGCNRQRSGCRATPFVPRHPRCRVCR